MYPRFPIPHDLGDELFGIFRVFEHLVADHIVERLLSEGEQFAVGFDELLVRIDQYLPAAVRVVLQYLSAMTSERYIGLCPEPISRTISFRLIARS